MCFGGDHLQEQEGFLQQVFSCRIEGEKKKKKGGGGELMGSQSLLTVLTTLVFLLMVVLMVKIRVCEHAAVGTGSFGILHVIVRLT